jgi:hypothetical protein
MVGDPLGGGCRSSNNDIVPRYGLRVSGYEVRVTRFGLRGAGYALRGSGYEVRVTRYEVRDTGCVLRVAGFIIRDVRCNP